MSNLSITNKKDVNSPFDSIRAFDKQGNECWYARQLMPVLGYRKWERVPSVIERAMASCENAGNTRTLSLVGTLVIL